MIKLFDMINENNTYPTHGINTKKKKPYMKILVIAVGIVLVLCLGTSLYCTACARTLPEGQSVEVTIDEGSSSWVIADKMAKAGVVDNTFVFRLTVTEMGADSSLKAGTYIFEGGKSVRDYVQILCDGPDATSPKVVVHEGMRLSKIAEAVDATTKGRVSSQDFINAASDASKYANDYDFLSELGTNSLEGFLFPKTYAVSSKDSAEDIVRKMLDSFREETKDLNWDYPKSCNLTMWEAVTLASIVEKESAEGMHGKVASVFYNRLNGGMHVNSDATTAYEVGHDPTPEEIHSNSPYSTYTNYGLPPTAICSPGIDALRAVCWPEQTNYLFFVFKTNEKGELEYRFSETFEEHQQAIIDLGLV